MRAFKTVLLLASVGLGAAGGLFGTQVLLDRLSGESADARTENGAARNATPVDVTQSQVESFRETVEAVGTTRARQSINMVSLASGRIDHIAFSGGESVEAGQLLVQLDDRAQRVAVKEAEALLAEARGNFERMQSLRERNVSSEANLEQARAAFLRAQAGLERAQNELDDCQVRAPFSGIIGLRQVEPGARIDNETVITSLDDLSEVEIEFSIPEAFLARVDIGTAVVARSDSFADRAFDGKVSVIDSRIGRTARAFKVRASFPNEDLRLRTGMFMSLEIVIDERRSISVPEEAIVSEGERNYIYQVEDGRARRVEVSLGLRRNGIVEIRSGLGPQTEVITSGVQSIEDGTAVRRPEDGGTTPTPDVS